MITIIITVERLYGAMTREQFNTRLPDDYARGVKQYAEDHEITKSETVRRACSEFLDVRSYPHTPEQKPITDSDTLRKPITDLLRFHADFFSATMWISIIALILGAPFFSATEYLAFAVASGILAGSITLPLATSIPDRADRWVIYHADRTTKRIEGAIA